MFVLFAYVLYTHFRYLLVHDMYVLMTCIVWYVVYSEIDIFCKALSIFMMLQISTAMMIKKSLKMQWSCWKWMKYHLKIIWHPHHLVDLELLPEKQSQCLTLLALRNWRCISYPQLCRLWNFGWIWTARPCWLWEAVPIGRFLKINCWKATYMQSSKIPINLWLLIKMNLSTGLGLCTIFISVSCRISECTGVNNC